jgi:coenzyme F420-0:L-glutamate ligase/coenzyme F420-1:gamma-L-glutamate ligase
MNDVRLIGISGIPMVQAGDDLAGLMFDAAAAQGSPLEAGDVLVVTQRVSSKAEGRVVPLDSFEPSPFALDWGQRYEKDPRQIEAVLRESVRIVRQVRGIIVAETRHGLICANAGVDASNVGGADVISLLPVDPDASCRAIRDAARDRLGIEVAVVMTDTFGRAWREGQTNVAIGVAGMRPLRSYEGVQDLDGRELRVTMPCPADELAAASGLVMEKLVAIPAVIVRGFEYERGEGTAREIVRPFERDLFP